MIRQFCAQLRDGRKYERAWIALQCFVGPGAAAPQRGPGLGPVRCRSSRRSVVSAPPVARPTDRQPGRVPPATRAGDYLAGAGSPRAVPSAVSPVAPPPARRSTPG
ncbi:hypothetical protein ACPA9J_03835 [Pseudomonas aeruginosa]